MRKGMSRAVSVIMVLAMAMLVILAAGALFDTNLERLVNFGVQNSNLSEG